MFSVFCKVQTCEDHGSHHESREEPITVQAVLVCDWRKLSGELLHLQASEDQ